jgi:hypothetical protein
MQFSAMYIANYMQEGVRQGGHDRGALLRKSLAEKQGAEIFISAPIWLIPSPRYFAKHFCNAYCMMPKAWQAAVVTTGVLPDAPGLKRITPSSVAQKSRTPERL